MAFSRIDNDDKTMAFRYLPIVAMALSGYSDRKKGSMWIANCKRFSQQVRN